MATAFPMPELAPVTSAFWPLSTRRTWHEGMTTGGCPSVRTERMTISRGKVGGGGRLEQLGDEARPAGLVRSTDAAAGVAVEVLVEEHVVAEMRVVLHLRVVAEDRPPAAPVLEEDVAEPVAQLAGDLLQAEEVAGAGRAFDAEVVAVVFVELADRFDQQV